ncbi:MAG: DUF6505 family protein [Marivibrio sp.]|uniref:DUF6505 family protein n=1 Tax=Marivibrio sp. TaxID=2039719 RepID=UPI0032EDF674
MSARTRNVLRVIRLDESDAHIFETPAGPGEIAAPGGFAFADADPAALSGRDLIAFGQTFLGLESFGRATLVQAARADAAEVEAAARALARHFVDRYGAPDLESALPVARDELAYAESLCADAEPGQLLAIEREFGEDGVIERVRAIKRPDAMDHGRVWTLIPDENEG